MVYWVSCVTLACNASRKEGDGGLKRVLFLECIIQPHREPVWRSDITISQDLHARCMMQPPI